jgi:hypothetical protein
MPGTEQSLICPPVAVVIGELELEDGGIDVVVVVAEKIGVSAEEMLASAC